MIVTSSSVHPLKWSETSNASDLIDEGAGVIEQPADEEEEDVPTSLRCTWCSIISTDFFIFSRRALLLRLFLVFFAGVASMGLVAL